MTNWRYFIASTVIAVVAVIGVALLTRSWVDVYLVITLAILEISLSFDNAVVNAKILHHMPPKWQRRFIVWGILIAVFGMRLVFPIVLVYASTPLGLWQTIALSWQDPHRYTQLLNEGYPTISAFGGAFLLMVFCQFLFDKGRDTLWLTWFEGLQPIRWLAKWHYSYVVVVLSIGVVFCLLMSNVHVVFAYVLGVLVYFVLHWVSQVCGGDQAALTQALKQGALGFIYLEILDASFSLDGVIGAFAITTNILIIMVGLGVGAFFVRSLTIFFVEKKTLLKYRYLEHGAFYAIGFLGVVLLAKNFGHIPEVITASVGLVFVIAGYLSSLKHH